MLSQFLIYLVDDLKKTFKEVDLCILYPALLSPEVLSKRSTLYVSASSIKKAELLATGDQKVTVQIIVYIRAISSFADVENMALPDLAANLLSYISNKKWGVSYTFPAQDAQAQDCYGVNRDNAHLILGENSKLMPSVLARAQSLCDNTHGEENVSVWVVSWEQPLQFNQFEN